jgi:type I restriction enzyme S subunit
VKREPATLEAVCESIRYGYTASANETPCGPHFLRITDIVPETINWETVPYCEIDENDKERFCLSVGDIVVARTGPQLGMQSPSVNQLTRFLLPI